ncbi:FYVE zinc finger-domain-containing protein [Tuber brumale]|nr:FYVE zinc finger-domain-containing protein [Tuber brumale]
MVCPICSEEMVTLLQLNRHLDDIHKEVEEVEKDDISTWFRKRMLKAKAFQPVAVLNQKLKGLDVFESNEALATAGPSSNPVIASTTVIEERDPDYLVTRAHWQRSAVDDYCLDPVCRKPLGAVNGSVNCRKCGKLFCEEHTMYQMKLSRSAQHEPVRGFWCRVCETCYKSREGYNDHQGLVRDHTKEFSERRRRTVDRAYLEVTRLEKRLTKLTQLLINPPEPPPGTSGFIKAVSSLRNQRKAIEQSVVAWEDDANVTACPHCHQTFSQFTIRKHHCRLCGRVVCGDSRTDCSSDVGLNVSATTGALSEKTLNEMSIDVRICRACRTTVFSKRDFVLDLAKIPQDVRAYQTLVQFEQGIKNMMPRFQKLLTEIQDPNKTPTQAKLTEATKTRKKLLDTFAQYDATAKRILNLPTTSQTQQRLQKTVYQATTQFLHLNMLPLKALPKLLNMNRPASTRIQTISSTNGNNKPSSSRALTMVTTEEGEGGAEVDSSAALKEKELKEGLIVLEEQRFMVQEMLTEASKRRRFDEVAALAASLEELDREVERMNGEIAKLES